MDVYRKLKESCNNIRLFLNQDYINWFLASRIFLSSQEDKTSRHLSPLR